MNDSLSALCRDQQRRWLDGERAVVEEYLERTPGLRENAEAVLDLIYNEIVLRERRGEMPLLDEYLRRFPQFAAQLEVQFQVHVMIEGAFLASRGADRKPKEPAPVPTFPGYEILAELGRGGMGVVYKARQLNLNRLVALKVIGSGVHASQQELTRFQIEAQAAARLRHANIVQIYEIGEHAGARYLAMELIDGTNLEEFTRGQTPSAADAAALIETLARTMAHVHQQGIVHRDLKPANVLLQEVASGQWSVVSKDKKGLDSSLTTDHWPLTTLQMTTPKITDFGLAKLIHDGPAQSVTKTLIGTPYYMAPEQAAGHGTPVGPPADIYALGAIFYELLTGAPPFHGKSVLEVLDRVRAEDPMPPRQIAPDVPADLETICLKCLKKTPAERYASALDLAEDLRRFRDDEPIRARPTGLLERAGKWVKRRPALAGIVAVTVLAASVLALLDLQFRFSLRAQVNQTRAEERGQLQDARDAYQLFAKHRSDALFHWSFASQFPSDAAKHLQAARQSIQQALALAGCNAGRTAPPVMNPLWSEREKAEVLAGAYQLLLVLAEAQAFPLPGQSDEAHRVRLRQALDVLDRVAANMPHTQGYHLRRARYLERLGDGPGAQRERDLAKNLAPAALLDHLALGDEWFQQRDFGRAAQSYQQALLAEPGDFWARFFLAICKLNLQDPVAAEQGLSQCLTQRPDFTWALLYRGSARGELNRFEAGESDFRQALKAELPPDARYVVLVARSRLRSRAEQLDRAIADLEEAVALLPDQFHARFNLARLLQAQGRLAESNGQFERALRLLLPLAEKDRDLARIAAECQIERSRNLRLSKDPSRALEAAESACKIAPDHADAWQCRALALLELSRFADARASLDQFQAKGGKPGPDFYAARGRARMQLGDYLGAKDDYTHGLDLAPFEFDTFRASGPLSPGTPGERVGVRGIEVSEILGKIPERRVVQPPHPDPLPRSTGGEGERCRLQRTLGPRVELFLHRGWAYAFADAWKPALHDFEEALRLAPKNADGVVGRGLARVMLGQVAEGLADADEACRLEPRTPEMMHNLACIFALAAGKGAQDPGVGERAVAAIRKCMAMVPTDQRYAFWRDKVSPDKALDAVRGLASFQEIEEAHAKPPSRKE